MGGVSCGVFVVAWCGVFFVKKIAGQHTQARTQQTDAHIRMMLKRSEMLNERLSLSLDTGQL